MFGILNTKNAAGARDVVEALHECQAIFEISVDGKFLTANALALQMTGFELNEILGKTYSSFDDPTEKGVGPDELWANLQAGKVQIADRCRVVKGGRRVWMHATFIPIRGRDGKVARVIELVSDITIQKERGFEDAGQVAAIARSQAVIEFDLNGKVLTANRLFLDAMGYSLGEIVGRHHSMFLEPGERDTPEYRDFWGTLRRGEYISREFKRIGKDGREVYILGSYSPILDEKGIPIKVVKIATDVSIAKFKTADLAGQINAISKSQAVIEFDVDGIVLNANQNFLTAMGYTLADIKGRHHSMFVAPSEREGEKYREFWALLRRGEYQTAEFRRIGNGGREVWIQASYNPILDLNGKPSKIVKYATDTTQQVLVRKGNERVCQMMESVAAGAEELNASVREISEAMSKSRQTATVAVERVEAAGAQAKRFSDAARAMEGIVALIGQITGQINLLALNATIESARAGEAGRGFAVVASEVKNLASQAKQATEKIGSEIENLNSISSDVVAALGMIRDAIQGVNEYVTTTAAAVEEQSTVTSEMSSSMQRAAAEAAAMTRQ